MSITLNQIKNESPIQQGLKRMAVGMGAFLISIGIFPMYANGMENDYKPSVINQAGADQNSSIKGTVLDENGEPLIGVTIRTMNGKVGTVTDIDGNFTINVKPGTQLKLSYTGYKDLVVNKGGTIRMEPDVLGLEDVVVIGYGTVKKKDLTGAVTTMHNEDITISPTNDVMESLQGKVAGLDITKTSGQTGSGVQVLLRGSRSIYGDNSPLFIIDGLPGSYDEVSPNDIESVDVLKDASATAIYGSAGANGVIIITTKRGKQGKTRVNFDAYYGWSGSPKYKHSMIGEEWTNYYREAYKYKNGSYPDNISALMNGTQEYIDAYNNNKWIDWIDECSGGTATTQKYDLSVTAGTENTKIFASAVYTNETGILANDELDKYALRLNLDQKVFSWARVGITSNLTYSIKDAANSKTFTNSLTAFPLGDVYDENGQLNAEYITNQYTPLGDEIENQYAHNTRTTYISATGFIEIEPLSGLKFRTQINGVLNHYRLGQYWGANATSPRPSYAGTPSAEIDSGDTYDYTWENILSYNKTIAKDHDISGTFVTSWQKNSDESVLANGSNQDLDVWQYWRLIAATQQRIESNYTQTQKMSYAVRLNYSYKGRYLATFSNRWDGVSFFSAGHKWDSFPAAAIGWRISDEPFMKGTNKWLDNLKLRVGWGVTGNSGGVGAYATQTAAYKYPQWGVSIGGTYVPFTQYSGTYGSSTLGWEKSYNWNFGLDFGFLNGIIDGSVDVFSTRTHGLLYKRTMPITSGVTGWGSPLSSWQNIAKTENHGVEFTINSHNFRTKDFTWNTTLTGTWQKEKIVSLPSGDLISESLFEGQPIHSIYDYEYAGIWSSDTPQETLDAYGVKPGWVKINTVETIADDGTSDGGVHKYSINDRKVLGHTNPNWILGLNNTFIYKDFDLSVFAMMRYGQTIYSKLLGYYTATDSIFTNQISGCDYWTEDHQNAYYPIPGSGDEQTVMSALRVHDGSFIKIKNITLGYTLPKSISKHALMDRCRFYFTCYNPFIFVKDKQLKGTDPEMGGSDAFPTYKQFVFGINITFM
jgi:TonB-linked SusC/RagA family outer membrane protein